jgi:hypothetical protein
MTSCSTGGACAITASRHPACGAGTSPPPIGDRRFGRSAALLLDRLAAPPPAAASRWALPDVRLRPPRHTRPLPRMRPGGGNGGE